MKFAVLLAATLGICIAATVLQYPLETSRRDGADLSDSPCKKNSDSEYTVSSTIQTNTHDNSEPQFMGEGNVQDSEAHYESNPKNAEQGTSASKKNEDGSENSVDPAKGVLPSTEGGNEDETKNKVVSETDSFKAVPPGTTVISLEGAESAAEGNTTVSVVADNESSASAANAGEGGSTISAAEQGGSLGLSVSRIYSNNVHYTDGNGVQYYQSSDGTWYYYPSPSPSPSPAAKSQESGSSVLTKGGAEADAIGNTTTSVGADDSSGAASGNAKDDGSVITIASIGNAIGAAVS